MDKKTVERANEVARIVLAQVRKENEDHSRALSAALDKVAADYLKTMESYVKGQLLKHRDLDHGLGGATHCPTCGQPVKMILQDGTVVAGG